MAGGCGHREEIMLKGSPKRSVGISVSSLSDDKVNPHASNILISNGSISFIRINFQIL